MSNVIIILSAYLLVVNIVAFVLYGIDRKRAHHHHHNHKSKKRIPDSVLFWMARIGGGLGSWLAMSFFHHKKNHSEFKRQIPMWIMIWLFVFALVLIIFSGNLGKEIQDAGDSMIHSSNAF